MSDSAHFPSNFSNEEKNPSEIEEKKQWESPNFNIARITSSEILKSLANIPLKFTTESQLSSVVSGLLNLPESIVSLYCSNILHSQVTISTQTILNEYFANIESGLVYIADSQTAGVGREGRTWDSSSGSLMFSYKFSCDSSKAIALQLLLPLAVKKAIITAALAKSIEIVDLKIKYPNDVYYRNRKISGMLVDASSYGKKVVNNIGIGINVNNITNNASLEEYYPGVFNRECILENFFIEFDRLVNSLGSLEWERNLTEEYKQSWVHFNTNARLVKFDCEAKVIDISSNGVIVTCDSNGYIREIGNRNDIKFSDLIPY